jgi:GH15 family glucan-1,4-alpha-glucosidase
MTWVASHMYPSGVLAEQLNPYTGESLSATPLVWSHAVYVETVMQYLDGIHALGQCPECQNVVGSNA